MFQKIPDHIKVLKIDCHLSDYSIQNLPEELKHLNLCSCLWAEKKYFLKNIPPKLESIFDKQNNLSICESSKTIKYLYIYSFRSNDEKNIELDYPELINLSLVNTDKFFKINMPKLKILCTNTVIFEIIKKFIPPSLEVLRIQYIQRVEDSWFKDFPANIKQLELSFGSRHNNDIDVTYLHKLIFFKINTNSPKMFLRIPSELKFVICDYPDKLEIQNLYDCKIKTDNASNYNGLKGMYDFDDLSDFKYTKIY